METESLMTQLLKGGRGFGHMNHGKMLEEVSERKGAREVIHAVEKKIAKRENKSGKMNLVILRRGVQNSRSRKKERHGRYFFQGTSKCQ